MTERKYFLTVSKIDAGDNGCLPPLNTPRDDPKPRDNPKMSTTQRVIEHLLLVTGASRAMLQVRQYGADFAIAAEAVQHGQRQVRNTQSADDAPLLTVSGGLTEIRQDMHKDAAAGPDDVCARLCAPVMRDGALVGVISLHHCGAPRVWTTADHIELERSAARVLAALEAGRPAGEELRSAGIQALLDGVRVALDAQRCTFRQPVEEAYAFPVTFESRDARQRSLLGDFTIVQTGQPVIVKLLAERAQVIQPDCSVASDDPLFHKMLAHYGGMRAQMVTPFIVGDQLKGVLSVHELRATRAWTEGEKALAAKAAAMIGAVAEVP